jgi:aconitase A
MEGETMDEQKKVTARVGGGKCHKALLHTMPDGRVVLNIICGCPNTVNGHAVNSARIVCEGWDKANCKRSVA